MVSPQHGARTNREFRTRTEYHLTQVGHEPDSVRYVSITKQQTGFIKAPPPPTTYRQACHAAHYSGAIVLNAPSVRGDHSFVCCRLARRDSVDFRQKNELLGRRRGGRDYARRGLMPFCLNITVGAGRSTTVLAGGRQYSEPTMGQKITTSLSF